MPDLYWPQIKTILAPGFDCMRNRTVATDEGVFHVDLSDYPTVKRLHKVIAAAINAWERDANGQWKRGPERQGAGDERPCDASRRSAAAEDVEAFLTWVNDGMPEGPAIA